MNFIVQEIQTTDAGVTAVLPATTYPTKNEAEAAYHSILAVAAISQVAKHGAVIMNDQCQMIKSECYYHPTAVAGETEA